MTTKAAPHQQLFDAEAWARCHLRQAPTLQPETLHAVSGFALVLSLFKGSVCHHRASVAEFEHVTGRINYSDDLVQGLTECVAYYQFRYLAKGAFNARFERLRFRPNDRRPFVEAVLKGEKVLPADQMLAVLIIAYRIRNNLFHGLKSVHIWDDQANNISHAAKVLALALEADGN